MAASITEPLVAICRYDPMFKVDVLLHGPLHEHVGVKHENKMEMMALCLSLDSLIKQESIQYPDHRSEKGRRTSCFDDKAGVVTNTMQQVINKSFNSLSCPTFLQQSGLDRLFPNVTSLVSRPEKNSTHSEKSAMTNYLTQLSALNSGLGIAKQINHDVSRNLNLKYLAHQLSVLYQAINSIPSGKNIFSRHLKNIEENFHALKTCVTEMSSTDPDPLPTEVKDWMLEITDSIMETITSLPPGLTQELLAVSSVMHRGI